MTKHAKKEEENVEKEMAQAENPAESTTPEDATSNEGTTETVNEWEVKYNELNDRYLRLMADFDNFRKNSLKEKAEIILNGSAKTVEAILPVLDDMERAITENAKTDDINVVREGEQLIYNKLVNSLEGLGVKKIDTTDADFNTDYHEAIAMVPGMGDDKKGKVIDCVQAGYKINEKVIRHAKVAVGQ